MVSKKASPSRVRILVDLSAPGCAPIRAGVLGFYHRGKRLRELALLGVAAERHGLSCERTGEQLVLRGLHSVPAALPVLEEATPPAVDLSTAEEMLVPRSIVDQFL